MIQIEILTVGKLRESWLKEAADEYLKRLERFAKVTIQECHEQPVDDSKTGESQILHAIRNEAQILLMKINPSACSLALDVKGQPMSSMQFAQFLEKSSIQGTSRFQFIIGGSYGLDESIIKNTNQTLSLGPMTFPHQMARIILLEQIYRACKIISGQTYHK